MPRVLMVSYAFPPTGGPGVQRPAKFVQYLPDFGWTPLVWTGEHVAGLPTDDRLASELPKSLDRRSTGNWRTILKLQDYSRGDRRADHSNSGRDRIRAAFEWRRRWWAERAISLFVPDPALPWALRSIRALKKIISRERIDCLWSTYSPGSNHLVAWRLKRATGLPWVADFRDLWTDDYRYHPHAPCGKTWDRWLEDRFIAEADVVVGVTPAQTAILSEHRGSRHTRFETITNGADRRNFDTHLRTNIREALSIPTTSFVIAYVGSFVCTAEPYAIIDGYRMFRSRIAQDDGYDAQFRVVGTVTSKVSAYIQDSGIPVEVTGYLSHPDAIRNTIAADLLVSGNITTGRNCDSIVPAKTYEYMASGNPVLHVGTPGGSVDHVLKLAGAGTTVKPSAEGVCEEMFRAYTAWRSGRSLKGCTPERFARYERRELTRQLADVFSSLVPKERSSARDDLEFASEPRDSVSPIGDEVAACR